MKLLVVFACLIAAAVAEKCASANDCSSTTCSGTGWYLHCVDGQCVCTHDDLNGNQCTSDSDCHAISGSLGISCNIHIGPFHLVMKCISGECHCGRA